MTEPLLLQQLESPSGTGRDEPRSQISLPARTSNKRGCKPAPPFSLAVMRRPDASLEAGVVDHLSAERRFGALANREHRKRHTSRSRLSRHTGPTVKLEARTAWWAPGPSLT